MESVGSTNINSLNLENKLLEKLLVNFLKSELNKTGFKKAIIGLSGGIDSALVAYLLVKAIGRKNVIAVSLPYRTSNKNSFSDAEKIAKILKINFEKINITKIVDNFFKSAKVNNNVRRGNFMARTRMALLYDLSNRENALVIGTSNKTELLLGYGTQFGDLASAINPIGDLYKTQVRDLSKFIGVPKNIIDKKPSADLWIGQTDENDFGFSYDEVDKLLFYMIDEKMNLDELIKKGFKKNFILKVGKMIQRNQFKRRMPVIAKISNRTINVDFRYPRDWGY